jgi:hypothetical protein
MGEDDDDDWKGLQAKNDDCEGQKKITMINYWLIELHYYRYGDNTA